MGVNALGPLFPEQIINEESYVGDCNGTVKVAVGGNKVDAIGITCQDVVDEN
jgi:hypothetical protein